MNTDAKLTIERIAALVIPQFPEVQTTIAQLIGRERTNPISRVRGVVIYIALANGVSLNDAGEFFDRDRGTARHLAKTAQDEMDVNKKFNDKMKALDTEFLRKFAPDQIEKVSSL